MLKIAASEFNSHGYWTLALTDTLVPKASDLELFDQNGYDLTVLEQRYAQVNHVQPHAHRAHRMAIKQPWFTQKEAVSGAVLNHSLLFERKAYAGQALDQLKNWAKQLPLIHKVIAMRPKWGLDFSMDWVDHQGNAFEILHWECDGFDYQEMYMIKLAMQQRLSCIDFEHAAMSLLRLKHKWHHLDFFAQSDWKCNFFGIPKERFKMVIWQ